MKKVLLITSPRTSQWFEENGPVAAGLIEFAKKVSDKDMSLFVTSIDRLEFAISKNEVKIWDNYNQTDLADFDLIHLRNMDKSVNLFDYAAAITAYARSHGHDIVEDVDKGLALGKLSQMILFRLSNLPVPRTFASWDNQTLKRMIGDELSFPLIVKANNGMKGSDNHLVRSSEELDKILDQSLVQYVAQEYIPNDGDYRVLFNGYSQPPLVFKRLQIQGSHLSNTSKGSEATQQTVKDLGNGFDIALEAAKSVGRHFTGIDLMRHRETNKWVLLEANVNPALSMGVLLDTKAEFYAKMIKERVGK